MGKFILYALLVILASSLVNWTTLGRGAGATGYGPRGGWVGSGGGFGSGGSGHK